MKSFYRKNRKLCISTILGFLFVTILGTLLHFVYEWTNYNSIAGLFVPVNESTWEHMKLLYFPMLLYCGVEFPFLYRDYPHLLRADFMGIIAGTLLIPLLFYTYTGILGRHTLSLDVATFIISAGAAFLVRLTSLKSQKRSFTFISFIGVLILGACFFIFTYYPPSLALFSTSLSMRIML